ncbi:MAG TPA: aquaporin [Tepidisphaeraceae bacterium]|jgi:MIP family channel proteins|nr:aquaporin [Tepidisphaeraceae bacterium]
MKLLPPCVAEFIGTFTLCFIGIGAIHHFGPSGNLLAIAVAHGLAIATMVCATLHISGGQLNPACTAALMVTGKITVREGIAYILSQLAGAILASVLCLVIFNQKVVFEGTPALAPGISVATGILVEVILTFFLVFVIFGTGVDQRGRTLGGLSIGLAVTLDILFGGPLTGASMNPARSFGPAIVGGQWSAHYIYWIGPIAGGILAGLVYNSLYLKPKATT